MVLLQHTTATTTIAINVVTVCHTSCIKVVHTFAGIQT